MDGSAHFAKREHASAVRVNDRNRAAMPAFNERAAQRLDQNGTIHWSRGISLAGQNDGSACALVAKLERSIYTVAVMPQPFRSVARSRHALVILSIISLFLLPIAAQAALYAVSGGPRSWRDADWSSIGSLPPARSYPTRASLFCPAHRRLEGRLLSA